MSRTKQAAARRALARGDAHAVKISPGMAAKYIKAKVAGITIIPPKDNERKPTAIVSKRTGYTKAQISKGEPLFEGMVARVRPMKGGEIETIVLPIESTNIPRYIETLATHPDWDKLKASKDRFTLRFNIEGNFYGLNDPRQFGTMKQLATFLQGYKSSKNAAKSSAKSQREYLEMLEVVRIKRDHADLRNADQREKAKKKAAFVRAAKRKYETPKRFTKKGKLRGKKTKVRNR